MIGKGSLVFLIMISTLIYLLLLAGRLVKAVEKIAYGSKE